MINIKQFAEEISTLLNKQFDEPFNALLESSIIGYRATILKQEFDKNGRFPRGSESAICLPLISVKPIECCISEELDCTVRRTKDKVPSAVRTNFFSDPFMFVGTANMEKAFTYGKSDTVKYTLESSKFNKDGIYYDYFNDYIYVFNYEGGKLGVRDIFSNLLQLKELINCDGKSCLEDIYIEDDMKRAIKQMVLEEFRITRTVPEEQQVKINEQTV